MATSLARQVLAVYTRQTPAFQPRSPREVTSWATAIERRLRHRRKRAGERVVVKRAGGRVHVRVAVETDGATSVRLGPKDDRLEKAVMAVGLVLSLAALGLAPFVIDHLGLRYRVYAIAGVAAAALNFSAALVWLWRNRRLAGTLTIINLSRRSDASDGVSVSDARHNSGNVEVTATAETEND